MPKFKRYLAIDYFHGNEQHAASLVAVHPDDPERLHWNGGNSYTTGIEGKHYAILKHYRVKDYMQRAHAEDERDRRAEAEETIEKDFYKEFHRPTPDAPRQSAGWIAPDGRFYACRYNEHDWLAKCLCICIYDDYPYSCSGFLEEKHWLRILSEGVLNWGGYRGKISQAQYDTLNELAKVSVGKYQQFIRRELENAEVMI